MRTLCAAVLTFESIIVAPRYTGRDRRLRRFCHGWNPRRGAIMVACLFVAGSQKRSWGLLAGWILQVIIIAMGFVVPTMFFLGLVFAILWFYAIRVGRRGDAVKAAREAQGSAT